MGERPWIFKIFLHVLYQLENVSILHGTKEKNILILPEASQKSIIKIIHTFLFN